VSDLVAHGDHADTISGGEGNDILFGQSGDDRLNGEAGDDWLIGGDGQDRIDGGYGRDNESNGNTSSSSLRRAVEGKLIDWTDSFRNFGVPFAPFGKLGLGKSGGSDSPASFHLLDLDK
jgi:Ca2+-binding RTX toxin-like protein